MGPMETLHRFLGWNSEPEGMPAKPPPLREQLDQMSSTGSSKFSPPREEEEGSRPRMSHSQPILNAARVVSNEEEATDWLEICAGKVGLVIRDLPECPHSSRWRQATEEGHLCGKCLSIATNLAAIKTGLKEVVGLDSDENFYNRVDSLLEVLGDMSLVSLSSILCRQAISLTIFNLQSQTNVKLTSREQPMKHRFPGLWMLVEDERRKELNQDEARNDPNRQGERLARSIFNYLKKPEDFLEMLKERIIDFLPKDDWERDFEEAESENHAAAQEALFEALAKYTPCGTCEHQDAKDPPSVHPARLFLMRLQSKEDLVRFDVIASSTSNWSWEELCIEIPTYVANLLQTSIFLPNTLVQIN